MNLINREKVDQNELDSCAAYHQFTLPDRLSDADAKENHISVYINMDYKQVIGKEVYDFALLSQSSCPVYGEHESITDTIYILILWSDGVLFKVEICQGEYAEGKWLKELKIPATVYVPRKDYRTIIKSIPIQKSRQFYFDTIGIHELNRKYYYAASNCVVTASGINGDIRAIQPGFNLELSDKNFDLKSLEPNAIREFIRYNNWNFHVFYPIHCIPILAILRYFLKKQDPPSGAVLWIDGDVGSGKTQLSVTMGDYFNRTNGSGLSAHLCTTKAKFNDVSRKLAASRNAVLILDDVKKEESSRSRENTKNLTDLVVRSIYSGKIDAINGDGAEVDASAIITGEFFKEQASTISRVLYLQISNFLNDAKNSAHFRTIQENQYYLADFMACFLVWLLEEMENPQNIKNMCTKLDSLKRGKELNEYFSGKKIGSRIMETVANYQLVSEMLSSFFKNKGITESECKEFLKQSQNALFELGKATHLRSLNYTPLYKIALQDVLPFLKIKDCRYGEKYLHYASLIEHQNIYFDPEELFDKPEWKDRKPDTNGISSEKPLDLHSTFYLFGMEKEYNGILFKREQRETLLVRKDILCTMIENKMFSYAKKYNINFLKSQFTDTDILTGLSESHAICGYHRKDGAFNKIINFPEYFLDDNHIANGTRYLCSRSCQMLKINIDEIAYTCLRPAPITTMENFYEKSEKILKDRSIRGVSHYTQIKNNMKDAFSEIGRFVDLK